MDIRRAAAMNASIRNLVFVPFAFGDRSAEFGSFYSAPDSGAEYCDQRVCLCVLCVCVCVCVCVWVCDHIFGTVRPIFAKFLCMSPVAVARSSSFRFYG